MLIGFLNDIEEINFLRNNTWERGARVPKHGSSPNSDKKQQRLMVQTFGFVVLGTEEHCKDLEQHFAFKNNKNMEDNITIKMITL